MPELPLDHDQRDALVRHLDRVRMPELVGQSDAGYPLWRRHDAAACVPRRSPIAVLRSVHG